jgi:hypothetical protein
MSKVSRLLFSDSTKPITEPLGVDDEHAAAGDQPAGQARIVPQQVEEGVHPTEMPIRALP